MVRFLRVTAAGALLCGAVLGTMSVIGCGNGDDLFALGPDGSSSDSASTGVDAASGVTNAGPDANSLLDATLPQDGSVSETEAGAPDAGTGDGATRDVSLVMDADAAPGDGAADVATETDADATTDASEGASPDAPPDSSPSLQDDAADAEESDALGPTEKVLLTTRGAACLACGETCISPNQDDITCDQFVGDQLTRCLQTVACALSNGCTTAGTDPTCLCGDADASACAVGTPSGPCAAYYEADFPEAGAAAILSDFEDWGLPTGIANQIVACLAGLYGCPACL